MLASQQEQQRIASDTQNYEDQPEMESTPSPPQIVILWDLLKKRLRPSELTEMARLLSQELIDNLEDLRSELENLISINNDIRQDRLQRQGAKEKEDSQSMMSTTMTKSIFSETKNACFLNQELVMFVENLQQKATESGLKEDALIPLETKKERQIYSNVRQSLHSSGQQQRPQSAITNPGKAAKRENSPTQTAMRSSFYSMSLMNEQERAQIEQDEQIEAQANKYKAEQERRGAVLDQLNITNILELSQRDQEVLKQIKKFMTQQESELQQEIAVMQRLMLEQATQKQNDSDEESDSQEDEVLTQNDLKEYSKKLQDGLLKSDHTIRIAQLPSPAATPSTVLKKPPTIGKLASQEKSDPVGTLSGGLGKFKPAPLSAAKSTVLAAPIKLRTSSRGGLNRLPTTIGSATQPVKVPPRPESGSSGFKSIAKNAILPTSGEAASSSSGFKKFKMSNVVTVSSSGRLSASASQQWKTASISKATAGGEDAGSGTKIPLNRIKLNTTASGAAAASEAGPAQGGSTRSLAGVQKIKLQGGQRRSSASRIAKVIEDPQIILNQVSKRANQVSAEPPSTMINTTTSQARGRASQEPKSDSLYGLDIDILKSLNLDNLIEENKEEPQQKPSDDPMNKTMTELREEHGMEPGLRTAASKLRMRCSFYQEKYATEQQSSKPSDQGL